MGLLRLSHVEIRVPDLELATAYYSEVVGMYETARESDRVYMKCWDEHQHHSVVLKYAPTHGLEHFGFKVQYQEDLDFYEGRLRAAGIGVRRFALGEWGPGHGEAIQFSVPGGHDMQLVWAMEQVGNLLPLTNPPPRPIGLVGIAPPRVDHIFLTCENVTEVTAFYRDVLDFRLTEQIMGDDGFQLASWLEVSNTSHDLALVTGPDRGFHHVAYWVDDWNALREAADVCAYHGVSVETNPTKHGATRGYCLYFFDPAGNRNEVFTGGQTWVDPGVEPTTWTEAEMGRALFAYDGVVNQRFLTVHT